ncbi:MAG: Asp-tRNA(Asn)/Glu-tRNA(Gln) amidotransferase subunit GatC [Verrucomicrobiae bacterium]|nr:Asp-tRNA(Asn)/Glu-tRNA(Gln) amidotransferase subunit GatC [Verrucomicrobiae bacterium]
MTDTGMNVHQVAHLARLELSAAEATAFQAQLAEILTYVEKLKAVDIAHVEPTAHPFPLENVTRPDEVRPSLPHAEALRNAPARSEGLFVVPKIVE